MAIQEKVETIGWLIENAGKLHFEVKKFTWIDEVLPGYYDYRVSIKIADKKYVGRGTDLSQEEAILKGYSEALESFLCDYYKFYSTGLAIHTALEEAKKKAFRELIERDIFFTHFVNSIPFSEVELPINDIKILNYLSSNHLKLRFFTSPFILPEGLHFCFCVVESLKGEGAAIGLNVHENLGIAQNHALLEALRNVTAFIKGKFSSLSLRNFFKIQNHGPFEHLRLAWDGEYWNTFSRIFLTSSCDTKVKYSIDVNYTRYYFFNLFDDSPFIAVRATAEQAQKSFYGPYFSHYQNLSRKYSDSKLTLNFPHPIG